MQKLIMFNGPPRSGKDTAAEAIKELIGSNMAHVKFTDVVKKHAHDAYGINTSFGGAYVPVPNDHFESLKDQPLDVFGGKTPRQAYIETSARMRRLYGDHVIAERTVESLSAYSEDYVINTDLGYDFEAEHLRDYFGSENTILIRIHRLGKNYDADCRTHVDLPGVRSIDVENRNRDDFKQAIKDVLRTSFKISQVTQVQTKGQEYVRSYA